MTEAARCPECQAPLFQTNERDGGGLILRSKLLKIDEESRTVRGQCHKCKRWVDLPLRMIPSPRLTLRT